ncbi:streptogrisin B precursor [Streptomyces durbertensis]|uniref:Streptogrisin B n=1 Tax=Streptomyces durbertensis TaxID=2448886 RepID=A0ABR6EH07_9ACTN|nr:S1 family peptidase [Streptomyces durbertensis]MBB1244614.1 streptogrisin B precursor [Streptomyces durbertensis]
MTTGIPLQGPTGDKRRYGRGTRRGAGRRRHAAHAALVAVLCAVLAALGLGGATSAAAKGAVPATADASKPAIRGGNVLHSTFGSCVVSVNAARGDQRYAVMAGHCGGLGTIWYADAGLLRPVAVGESSGYPSRQYVVIRYTSTEFGYPSELVGAPAGGPVRVTGVRSPAPGVTVCHRTATTGVRCGTITAVNQTVNLPQGTLTGLFRTSLCAEPGDPPPGTVAYSGSQVVGFLLAASGNCRTGGTTFHQPLAPILAAHNLTVVY